MILSALIIANNKAKCCFMQLKVEYRVMLMLILAFNVSLMYYPYIPLAELSIRSSQMINIG